MTLILSIVFGALTYMLIRSEVGAKTEGELTSKALFASTLRGTVESVDATSNTIRLRSLELTDAAGNAQQYEIFVGSAPIVEQHLVAQNGVFLGLTEPKASTLSDILPATPIVVFAMQNMGRIEAKKIIFGDPL